MKRTIQKTLEKWGLWNVKNRELLNLITGRKGGKTTIKIIDCILKKPYNKNQLAKTLNLDYNTIAYHVNIMKNHDYLTEEKFEKCYYYHPSKKLFNSIEEYNIIKENLQNENNFRK